MEKLEASWRDSWSASWRDPLVGRLPGGEPAGDGSAGRRRKRLADLDSWILVFGEAVLAVDLITT